MGVVLMKIVRESPDSFMHANDTAEMVFDFCDLQSHGTAAGFQQGIRFRNFAAHQLRDVSGAYSRLRDHHRMKTCSIMIT
jgi:hypothetical protein